MSANKTIAHILASCVVLTWILSFVSCNTLHENATKSATLIERNPTSPTPPNIIFFITDDALPEDFNFQTGQQNRLTPNIDKIAAEGVVMRNQTVASPVCTPSRYNVLTGNYASRSRDPVFLKKTKQEEGMTVVQFSSRITQEDQTLPMYLQQLDYMTGFVGKDHVTTKTVGLERIKDSAANIDDPSIQAILSRNYGKVTRAIQTAGFDFAGAIYHRNPQLFDIEQLRIHNLDWLVQEGLHFLEQASTKPFFLYFATTLPHFPADADHSWRSDPTIAASGRLENPPDGLPARATLQQRIHASGFEFTDRRANMLWIDDALGAILRKLDELNQLDNTIIIFFNDHGHSAKGSLYQGGILSPSIVWKRGGFPCGHESNELISNVDFAPTILEMAGIKDPNDFFDGTSFRNILEGGTAVPTTQYFELGYSRAVIRGKYKYLAVRYPKYARHMSIEERTDILQTLNTRRTAFGANTFAASSPSAPFGHLWLVPGGGPAEAFYAGVPGYFDRDQLYDIENDPNELVNLAYEEEYQNTLTEMKNVLRRYLDKLPGKFPL